MLKVRRSRSRSRSRCSVWVRLMVESEAMDLIKLCRLVEASQHANFSWNNQTTTTTEKWAIARITKNLKARRLMVGRVWTV